MDENASLPLKRPSPSIATVEVTLLGRDSTKDPRYNLRGMRRIIRVLEESHVGVPLLIFSAAYLILMHRLALHRALWIDEYVTFYVARLTPSEIANVLRTGAEQHPLPFLLLTRSSMQLFGSSAFALRLPAILGFLVMELCIFHFVAKRCSRAVAFTAMLVPFATRAVSYAMEARGFGLLLGFTALSLVCWQMTEGNAHRRRWTALLGFTLAAATCCHYFGALIVLPLALAEAVSSRVSGRVNPWLWVAFAASSVPLLLSFPFLSASRGYALHHGLLNTEFDYYSWLLVNAYAILLSLLFAVVVSRGRGENVTVYRRRAFSPAEIAATVGYCLLPVGVYVATRVVGLPFANRYVLSAAVGVSVLVAIAIESLPAADAVAIWMAAGLALAAAITFVARTTAAGVRTEADADFVAAHASGAASIVASDIETFFRLTSSAQPSVVQRAVCLTQPDASLRYLGNDTSERILTDLRPWLRMRVEPLCAFLDGTSEFQLYGPLDNRNWILRALADDVADMRIGAVNGDRLLITVRHNRAASRVCAQLAH